MSRFLLLALCAALAAGCASPFNGTGLQRLKLQPGDWCLVQLKTERIAPLSTQMQFLRGRVEDLDDQTIRLVDVIEEQRVLTGPQPVRRIPYLSRLTTYDSEFQLLETRLVSRAEIAWSTVLSAEDVRQFRQTLVPSGDKFIQERIGLDFDFNVPDQAHRTRFLPMSEVLRMSEADAP